MMYGAELTPFLKFAQSAGAQVRDGLGMLIEQAAEAFLWRGVRPKTELVCSPNYANKCRGKRSEEEIILVAVCVCH